MLNIWHIWHTKRKKPYLSNVSNAIIYTTCKQYRSKDGMVWIEMLKKYIVFYLFSLSSFMTFSILSLSFSFSFSSLFLRHSFSITLFNFLFSSSSFLLLSPKASLLFFSFFFFLSLSLHLFVSLGFKFY